MSKAIARLGCTLAGVAMITGGRRNSSSRTCSTTPARSNPRKRPEYLSARVGLALIQRLDRGVTVGPRLLAVAVFLDADPLGKPHRTRARAQSR